MNYMSSPKEIHLMAHSMCPVVGKVNQEKQREPVEPIAFKLEEAEVAVNEFVSTYS